MVFQWNFDIFFCVCLFLCLRLFFSVGFFTFSRVYP